MKRLALVAAVLVVAACSTKETPKADTAAPMSVASRDSRPSGPRGCMWTASAPAATDATADSASCPGVTGTPAPVRPPLRHTLIRLITRPACHLAESAA